ncbi:MAG: hypothetical protein R3B51_07145 [Thermodesulfobacteriota bacterium]
MEKRSPEIDGTKLERALSMLERDADSVDENPKQTADFMRKLTDAAGISMGEGMEGRSPVWSGARIRTK